MGRRGCGESAVRCGVRPRAAGPARSFRARSGTHARRSQWDAPATSSPRASHGRPLAPAARVGAHPAVLVVTRVLLALVAVPPAVAEMSAQSNLAGWIDEYSGCAETCTFGADSCRRRGIDECIRLNTISFLASGSLAGRVPCAWRETSSARRSPRRTAHQRRPDGNADGFLVPDRRRSPGET